MGAVDRLRHGVHAIGIDFGLGHDERNARGLDLLFRADEPLRRYESIGERVFGGDDVAGPAGQHRDQLSAGGTGDVLRPGRGILRAHPPPMAEARISTLP